MKLGFLLAAVALAPASGCAEAGGQGGSNQALAVYERTKNMNGVWSSYSWNWMRRDGRPHQDWAAEFHRDTLHRVETSEWRIIADCAAQTGVMVNVATGERLDGPRIAGAACGIQSNSPILSMELLGNRLGRHGAADVLKIVDPENERFYGVDPNGVLVASEIFARVGDNPFCLQSEAVAVEPGLPEEDIFTEASLARSVVPERFRSSPGEPTRNLWLSGRRCI